MNAAVRFILVAAFVAIGGPAAAAPSLQGVRLALTFDDLPWVGAEPVDGSATDAVNRIAAVLNAHNAPATGFVVCDRYQQQKGPVDAWADWGLAIGNHSSSHMDLNTSVATAWIEDVRRCDMQLRKFSGYHHLFRFPMLHRGETRAKRDAAATALAGMKLRTAPVTVDTSDWILTQYHARAIRQDNAGLRRQVGETFIEHVLAMVRHADKVSRRKLGRRVPQILLLHANALTDDYLDELLLALRRDGVRFVALNKALADPAYRRADGYAGSKGLSWLYRMKPATPEDAARDDMEAAHIRKTLGAAFLRAGQSARSTKISALPVGDRGNAKLMTLLEEAGRSERWRSLIIYQRGKVELEAYFNGVDESTPQNLKSVTKSVTALLTGKALEAGWIKHLDDTLADYLPVGKSLIPKPPIRIKELLTMSTGLVPVSYGEIQERSDWIGAVLKAGIASDWRGKFRYDTPVLQLLSAAIENASGKHSMELANSELLAGSDAKIAYWRRDPDGYALGGNDAYLTPRGMLDLGKLVLHDGVLNGQRILGADFVKQAASARIKPASDTINHGTLPVEGYGYLWWLTRIGGEKAVAALGHGGQMIFVVPSRDSVIIVTSRWPMQSSVAHYRHVTKMLNEKFLPMFWAPSIALNPAPRCARDCGTHP